MKETGFSFALAAGLLAAAPAWSAPPVPTAPAPRHEVVAGVDLDAVDWAKMCPEIQPLTVSRGGVTCKLVAPTSVVVRKYEDFRGGVTAPPPLNCELLAAEYKRVTTAKPTNQPWSACRYAFRDELQARSQWPELYNDMPFPAWRAHYFTKWLAAGGAK